MKLRRNCNPYKILKYLAVGSGVLLISTAAPLGGALMVKSLIRGYFRRRAFEKKRFLNDLKNLQTRELIDYKELADGRIKITLTKSGKEKMLIYQIDDMQLKKSARWDGRWRLIMFDIPHHYKKARDVFRKKLKDLKFYPLQKSVYITPYPCEEEIDFLASLFNVRNYVLLLEVANFEGEEKLKHYFGLI